jgi:uncharacterized protein
MVPARTCLGCRSRADRSALLRVVARDGRAVPDPSANLPGRGAWVHPTLDCVENAIKRKAFGRALRAEPGLRVEDVLAAVAAHDVTSSQPRQAD